MTNEGKFYGTWNVEAVGEAQVKKLTTLAEKCHRMVSEYTDQRNNYPEYFEPDDTFEDYWTEDGYKSYFVTVLNETEFNGEEVFETGGHFVGVAAQTLADLGLTKSGVEKALKKFLKKLGMKADVAFKWEYYDRDAPNADTF